MKSILSCLAPAFLLAACAVPSSPSAAPNSVSLLPAASAPIGPGASLRFDSVADSRCPRNVVCIQAGELRYHFTLTSGAGSEAFSLTPEAPSADLPKSGKRIALRAAQAPVPLRDANAPPAAPQSVTLTIHSL